MPRLLELENVAARYGPIVALHDVSLTVDEGEVVALLGANGAGKTTTLRAISGLVSKSGAVTYAGKDIRKASPERLAKLGIAHVRQRPLRHILELAGATCHAELQRQDHHRHQDEGRGQHRDHGAQPRSGFGVLRRARRSFLIGYQMKPSRPRNRAPIRASSDPIAPRPAPGPM